MKKEFLIIFSVVLAAVLVWLAIVLQSENEDENSAGQVFGPAGSEHSHMRLLMVVFGEPVDFSRPEYMLKSPLVHFEDARGTIIHKHATGVTLPYFFQTLGMKLTENCLTAPDQTEYCSLGQNTLSIFINRQLANQEILSSELASGDKILVNYGDESKLDLELKLNSIADLNEDYYR